MSIFHTVTPNEVTKKEHKKVISPPHMGRYVSANDLVIAFDHIVPQLKGAYFSHVTSKTITIIKTPYSVSKEAKIMLHNSKFSWLTRQHTEPLSPHNPLTYMLQAVNINIRLQDCTERGIAFSEKTKINKWAKPTKSCSFNEGKLGQIDCPFIYLYFFLQFHIFYCVWHKTAELLSITSRCKIEFWGREGEGVER